MTFRNACSVLVLLLALVFVPIVNAQSASCLDPTPDCAFANVVSSTQAWADSQNKAAVEYYQGLWPSYVEAVQIAQQRGGQNMPAPLLPHLKIHIVPTSVADMMANKPAVQIVYGTSTTDYVCTPNTLPEPPAQTGGIGYHTDPSPYFGALPGDAVPAGTIVKGTSKDGVTGSFLKIQLPWGGMYLKVG